MRKHSINVLGHQTSITLEDEFWVILKENAEMRGLSLNKLVAEIDDARSKGPDGPNLSSAIRLYILKTLQNRLS